MSPAFTIRKLVPLQSSPAQGGVLPSPADLRAPLTSIPDPEGAGWRTPAGSWPTWPGHEEQSEPIALVDAVRAQGEGGRSMGTRNSGSLPLTSIFSSAVGREVAPQPLFRGRQKWLFRDLGVGPGAQLSAHLPSSGSSLVQVSAVIRLAMKWWCPGGVRAGVPGLWLQTRVWAPEAGPCEAGCCQGLQRAPFLTPRCPFGPGRCSAAGAHSARLGRWEGSGHPADHAPLSLLPRLSGMGFLTHRPGSCPPASTSSAGRPGTGCGGPCPPGTSLPHLAPAGRGEPQGVRVLPGPGPWVSDTVAAAPSP